MHKCSIDDRDKHKNKHLPSTATEATKVARMPTRVLARSYTKEFLTRMPTQVLVRSCLLVSSVDIVVIMPWRLSTFPHALSPPIWLHTRFCDDCEVDFGGRPTDRS